MASDYNLFIGRIKLTRQLIRDLTNMYVFLDARKALPKDLADRLIDSGVIHKKAG